MEKLVQRVAAKAVLESEGGILALQPSSIDRNTRWHSPGGLRDDILEPIFQTLHREVMEETGIDISEFKTRVIKIGEWQAVDKGVPVKIFGVFFHIILPQRPSIKLSAEHKGYAWINLKNYLDYELHPDLKESVELVFSES